MLGTAVDSGDAMLNEQVTMAPHAGRNSGSLKCQGERGFLGELVKKIWKSTDKTSRQNTDDDIGAKVPENTRSYNLQKIKVNHILPKMYITRLSD